MERNIVAERVKSLRSAAQQHPLFVSDGTVESHVRRLMHKLRSSNRTEAVARYQSSRRNARSAAETLTP
ncbi:MAG: LuxR C-terminal-related transcriptional regulator [Mycobacterium sp.]